MATFLFFTELIVVGVQRAPAGLQCQQHQPDRFFSVGKVTAGRDTLPAVTNNHLLDKKTKGSHNAIPGVPI